MDIMILTFQISSHFVRTEIQVITCGKMTHRTLFQIIYFSRTDGFKYIFFNGIVNE